MGADKIRQARFNNLTDTESLSVAVNFRLMINFSTSTGVTSGRKKELALRFTYCKGHVSILGIYSFNFWPIEEK